ncbi:MAG: DUF4292 domain-containing protein [Armatimonadetes bacterium]|nr:DUF4292 domain-containing protein [Armatimonadota bacterium]
MLNRFSIFAPLLLATLLAACTGGKSTTTTTTTTTTPDTAAADAENSPYADLLSRLRESYQSTPNLAMKGTMKISGIPATIWYDAVVKRRDSLKITMTGPFGIAVGALGATPQGFLFFNAQSGEALEGRGDRETFRRMLQVGLSYDEIVSLMRGELPAIPEEGAYTAKPNGENVTFTVEKDSYRETFTVNPESLEVIEYQRVKVSGETTTEEISVAYKNFVSVASRRVAKRAQVSLSGGEQTMQVNIEEIRDIISNGIFCALQIPAGVTLRKI